MVIYKDLINVFDVWWCCSVVSDSLQPLTSIIPLTQLIFPYKESYLLKSDSEICVIRSIPLFCHGYQTSQN